MWYMNEERQMIKKMVQEFTQNEVKPFVKIMETEEKYPTELMKKAGELGILGLMYPESVGGAGEDLFNLSIALEEIAKESTTFALCVALSSYMASRPVYDHGTPDQIEKILKPVISGEQIIAFSLCEPAGIDMWFDYRTKAVLDGDEWVLNGGKIFCTNAGQAEYYGIMAVTGVPNPATAEGCSIIMVHKDTPGFKVGHIENKLGWHGSSTGQIYFNDCRVPKENIIGPLNQGFGLFGVNWMMSCVILATLALGGAEGVYQKTFDYCKERNHVGKSLYDSYQTVRHQLASMWIEIESLRAMIYGCEELITKGINATPNCVAAKIKGAKVFEFVASQAVLLNGGNGTVVENDIERYYRDAKMFSIGGGSIASLQDSLSHLINN